MFQTYTEEIVFFIDKHSLVLDLKVDKITLRLRGNYYGETKKGHR
jgi:hypothetical protein